ASLLPLPVTNAASRLALDVALTPRLSSHLSAPTSTAETSRVPASRIISPTAWTLVHDDRPAVTITTASAAQVWRWSLGSDGSRVARVSRTSAEAQAAAIASAGVC